MAGNKSPRKKKSSSSKRKDKAVWGDLYNMISGLDGVVRLSSEALLKIKNDESIYSKVANDPEMLDKFNNSACKIIGFKSKLKDIIDGTPKASAHTFVNNDNYANYLDSFVACTDIEVELNKCVTGDYYDVCDFAEDKIIEASK